MAHWINKYMMGSLRSLMLSGFRILLVRTLVEGLEPLSRYLTTGVTEMPGTLEKLSDPLWR